METQRMPSINKITQSRKLLVNSALYFLLKYLPHQIDNKVYYKSTIIGMFMPSFGESLLSCLCGKLNHSRDVNGTKIKHVVIRLFSCCLLAIKFIFMIHLKCR